MILPDHFQFNAQTVMTNVFQRQSMMQSVTKEAFAEFNAMVDMLKSHHIASSLYPVVQMQVLQMLYFQMWFSLHRIENDGIILILYPMLVENRRLERQPIVLRDALKNNQIQINKVIDLSFYERENKALEGTGSLVLDKKNKIAFAALSPRTHLEVLNDFANQLG